jgi:hypothetical protein
MSTVPVPYPEYATQLAYVRNAQAKDAFVFMVEQARMLPGYSAKPKAHGYIKHNLHYFDASGNDSFAFNVTQQWLLFYLRHPSVTHPNLSVDELQRTFKDATRTKLGELNIPL